ncbi:MAG: hypothetical protein HYY49_03665, partial [Ignavibacteriales bacterium]|nr:hypothetical protein [Ignavibacteriales bacterium]
MKVERRKFLQLMGTGTLATSLPHEPAFFQEQGTSKPQRLHEDYKSNNQGTEYYFLGNGLILAALQTSSNPEAGTHCGLLVMSPEHFGRKISSYLYHPERGLQNSRCFITAEGATNVPEAATSKVSWEYPDGIPTVVVEWKAGQFVIRETLMCPVHDPAVIRTIALKNVAQEDADTSATVLLYPNLMFFDEYNVDRKRGTLKAGGYKTMRLFSLNESIAGDRHLNVKFGSVPPGATRTITVVLTLD